MLIHQQQWSLECSVVETVASLLRGVTEHSLAGIQSHCPDKVVDIHTSLQQINVTVLVNFCFLRINEKDISFFTPRKTDAYYQLFRESGSEMAQSLWWNAFFIQYFSATSWVTSLAWQLSIVQTVLYPIAKTILPRLTTCVRQKIWDVFYDPPGNISSSCNIIFVLRSESAPTAPPFSRLRPSNLDVDLG